ncbi:MAG: hypothetical protein ACLF0G_17795 [Candidatus Brocadiia bacterium]
MERIHMTVSPQSWGLERSNHKDSKYLEVMGLPKAELEARARENTYTWLVKHFDNDAGAFHGFYDPRIRQFALPQTSNLIAPFQLIAAADRYEDEQLLIMARRSADWLETNMVETHPMSLVLGGVRDNIKPTQLWTKYTADYVTLNLALFDRMEDEELVERAERSSKFLLQSQNHGFAPKYDHATEQWMTKGWQSFGRVVVAMIALQEFTGNEEWLDRAMLWAEYGVGLQAADGSFYLINDDYYSSDIAADEIRGLIRAYWRTDRTRFLTAAVRFADWHLANQLPNGAWPLSVDRWGVSVADYVGPGDVPNIAIALLLSHMATNELAYLAGAVRAIRYSVAQQCLPGQEGMYFDDPNLHWGFWSWDPRYDYTMSSDQSTHHCRGYWFFLDYVLSLPEETRKALAELAGPPDEDLPRVPQELLSEG